jgi:hypothetical protein
MQIFFKTTFTGCYKLGSVKQKFCDAAITNKNIYSGNKNKKNLYGPAVFSLDNIFMCNSYP